MEIRRNLLGGESDTYPRHDNEGSLTSIRTGQTHDLRCSRGDKVRVPDVNGGHLYNYLW